MHSEQAIWYILSTPGKHFYSNWIIIFFKQPNSEKVLI